MPPTILFTGCSRYRNRETTPKVATPAADRPEQVRVRFGVDGDDLAVGRHHVRT
jgi:hypothetical protein